MTNREKKQFMREIEWQTEKETLEEREIVQSKTEGKSIIHGVNDF